jgi:hypothetical protein
VRGEAKAQAKEMKIHTNALEKQTATLDSHTKALETQTATLDSHTKALETQTTTLDSHTKVFQAHESSLDKITRSLTTRLLGTFPEYYENITDLLGEAQEKIVVFCDHAAYGSFSKRNIWKFHYHYILQRQLKEQERGVELTCLDQKGRRGLVKDQFFGAGKDLEAWKKDPDFMVKLGETLSAQSEPVRAEELTEDEFENIIEAEEKRTLAELRGAGAEIHEISADVPLYFWLIDSGTPRARAIFAIPSFSEKIVEYGFITEDQGLISAFEQMRDRYQKNYSQERASGTDARLQVSPE